jgi:hypothetical protein
MGSLSLSGEMRCLVKAVAELASLDLALRRNVLFLAFWISFVRVTEGLAQRDGSDYSPFRRTVLSHSH